MKVPEQAEARTFFSYPYEALEEVLANAVYHKSYELNNPIEVQVFPNRIEVLSFPGPLPPITQADLKKYRVVARDYRNRRIGDFLKELKLTEGRATGFPWIRSNMEKNDSPEPEFITDENNTYFLAILKIHPDFETVVQPSFDETINLFAVSDPDSLNRLLAYILAHDLDIQFVLKRSADNIDLKGDDRVNDRDSDRAYDRVSDRVNDVVNGIVGDRVHGKGDNIVNTILDTCRIPKNRTDVLGAIGLKNHVDNYKRYMLPLIEMSWLQKTEKETSPKQRYRTTKKGIILLELLNELEDMIK